MRSIVNIIVDVKIVFIMVFLGELPELSDVSCITCLFFLVFVEEDEKLLERICNK